MRYFVWVVFCLTIIPQVLIAFGDIQSIGETVFIDIPNNSVGIGSATPDSKAVLDIASTTKGVLMPRLTTTQRDAITTPTEGLVIYNTTSQQYEFYNGTVWGALGGGGGGSPSAGLTGEVQYSDGAGGFLAEANLAYDAAGDVLSIGGIKFGTVEFEQGIFRTTNSDIAFGVGSPTDEKMRVSSGGLKLASGYPLLIGTNAAPGFFGAIDAGFELQLEGNSQQDIRILDASGTTGQLDISAGDGTATITTPDSDLVLETTSAKDLVINTNSSEAMRVDSTGNVGIGTTTPGAKLEVNNNGESFIMIRSSDTLNSGIQFGDQSDSVQGAIYQNATDNSLRFNGYNNSEAMRIDSAGDVGIGTASPEGKTHIVSGTGGIAANANADELVIEGAGQVGMTISSSAGERGNIFFGDAAASTTGQITYSHTNDDMTFYTAATAQMLIQSDGDVGIGTTAPQGALHVAGVGATSQTAQGVSIGLTSGYAHTEHYGSNGGYVDFKNGSGDDADARIFYNGSLNTLSVGTGTGASGIVVNSTGAITMATQPAAVATRTTAQTLTDAANTIIIFNTEVRDQNADYNPANGIFSVPSAGTYLTCAQIFVENPTLENIERVRLWTTIGSVTTDVAETTEGSYLDAVDEMFYFSGCVAGYAASGNISWTIFVDKSAGGSASQISHGTVSFTKLN